ncbi:MAG: TIGR03067 domain-containing protein [Planctomycetia bacterium]
MNRIRNWFLPALLAVILPLAAGWRATGQEAGVAEQAEVARDRALYAGTWKIVAIESDGETKPGDVRRVIVVNHADGTWAMTVDGLETNRGESRIDPLASPPEIDIEITAGDGKGKVLQGIYEVSETHRRLCFRGEQGWRPREFRTQPGDGAVLVTFEKHQDDASGP